MKVILIFIFSLLYTCSGVCQNPDFVLTTRDSSYLNIFKYECIEHSLILEFGKMEVRLKDSILSGYIKNKNVFTRFDVSDIKDINFQNYGISAKQKIFFLYGTKTYFTNSFEENSETFYYIKFKDSMFIFYNQFGMLDKILLLKLVILYSMTWLKK